MKAFYDRILVNSANKIGKKYGAKVGEADVGTGKSYPLTYQIMRGNEMHAEYDAYDEAYRAFTDPAQGFGQGYHIQAGKSIDAPSVVVHSMPITPELKAKVLKEGLPLFKDGGFVDKPLYERAL